MSICLLIHTSLLNSFLSYAFFAAPFLIHRLPFSTLQDKSPFEKLFHRLLDYHHLKVFGCACFHLLKPYNSNKLQPKTSQCIFLWYPLEYKSYLCFNMSSAKLFTSRHVIFNKSTFPYSTLTSNSPPSSIPPSTSTSTNSTSFTPFLLVLINSNSRYLIQQSLQMRYWKLVSLST